LAARLFLSIAIHFESPGKPENHSLHVSISIAQGSDMHTDKLINYPLQGVRFGV
jgi:hypothetical protein